MGIIYKATNKQNGKVYIGKTSSCLRKRINLHIHMAFTKQSTTYFHNALRKYGRENFTFDILEETTEDLNDRERYFIAYLDSTNIHKGYNLTRGGDGGNTVSLLSPEKAALWKQRQDANRNNQGISSKMQKGRHVKEFLSKESQVVYDQNYRKALANRNERRAQGILTNKEIEGLKKHREYCQLESTRTERSARAKGSNNSQYKGPYIVNGITYNFVKDLREHFKVYGTINEISRQLKKKDYEVNF